jgi:aminoglycoside phosphotransferase
VAEAVPLERFGDLIPEGARRVLGDRPWRAVALPGGRQVNLCLQLMDPTGDACVLRIRRGPVLPGADFEREIACHQRAASAGLAPSIRSSDASQGWIVMDHVPGAPWTAASLEDDAALWRFGERLRRLHALEPPRFAPVSSLELLRANCEVLASRGDSDAARLMQRGEELTAGLSLLPARPPVMCHGDPDAANVLGPVPLLIDFEYAQVADATYDLALLLDYYPVLQTRRERLQAVMGLDDALSARRLPLQIELCHLVGVAWARAQAVLVGKP